MKESDQKLHLTTRGKIVAGFLGASMVAGGVTGLLELSNSSSDSMRQEQATALQATNEVLNTEVVLKGGAEVRLTPKISDGTPKDGLSNNVATTIPIGKQWTIKNPLAETTSGWVAFTTPGIDPTGIHSLRERATATVWVDLGVLESQGEAYRIPYKGEPDGAVAAQVLESGVIQTKGVDDPSLATAVESVDPDAQNIRVT